MTAPVTAPPFQVRVAVSEEDRAACFAVRAEVFIAEQGVPEELEYDALDADAVHLLAVGPQGPLGTARLLTGLADPGTGTLGRLAVVGRARGTGAGVALVRAVEAEAARLGLDAIELHAQTRALGFYERLGYAVFGPEFDEVGIPHRSMRRPLR
ncbi:GNAT family N-acetyltransferase [Streptomyces sp. NPDC093225]|uniref:GNAT family N-acetyltransferase n=1 Tax=Streptomyces sp. NPDC093225 TaxID=3366034 RepID=UPI0037FF350F